MDNRDGTNILISSDEILSELQKSKDESVVLGIFSQHLGAGTFLCRVKEIRRDEDEQDVVVVLHLLSGNWNDVHVLYLREIDRVFTFVTKRIETINE
jgi:hypothetical protein